MVKEFEISANYQQTEVGIVPSDWNCSELRNYFSFISYGFTNPMPTVGDGVYMITANDINNGRIKLETARRTTETAYNTLLTDKSRPKKNDILLTKDGTLGRLALVGDEKICINQSVAVLRPNNNAFPLFLKLLLEGTFYQKTMIENAGGSTIKHIYITIVDKMKIALPSTKPEQIVIATALSDTDALIENLEKLINKKRSIKQGVMQELFSGRKRLAGYNGKWKEKRLGEIGDIVTGSTPPTQIKEFWNGSIPWITPTDISNVKNIYHSEREISIAGLQVIRKLPADTLLVTCIASIGKNAILRNAGACNQQINAIIPYDDYNVDFLYYLIENNKQYLLGKAGITATLIISKKDFSVIRFSLPSKEEQTHIATILSNMDEEIDELEKKLHKYKMIKQGMMQVLLTGKIRLI